MLKQSSDSVRVFYRPYSREQLITRLREGLPALVGVLPVLRVVLFGSWATGRATAFSDIDILVVYAGATRADAYKVARRAFNVRGIELHLYAEAEAELLRPTLDRVTKLGIDLLAGSSEDPSIATPENPNDPNRST
jgi:predicted nucleotidyltransferase